MNELTLTSYEIWNGNDLSFSDILIGQFFLCTNGELFWKTGEENFCLIGWAGYGKNKSNRLQFYANHSELDIDPELKEQGNIVKIYDCPQLEWYLNLNTIIVEGNEDE